MSDPLVNCSDPHAETVACLICSKPVKTCAEQDGSPCAVHADGCEIDDGWVCSVECWETYAGPP